MKPKRSAAHFCINPAVRPQGTLSIMTFRTTALAAAAAALLLATATAQAATDPVETKVADASPQAHAIAGVDRDDEASCSRARRRLWIEGEGWVVRRITTCR
jgi:hypothetical protein